MIQTIIAIGLTLFVGASTQAGEPAAKSRKPTKSSMTYFSCKVMEPVEKKTKGKPSTVRNEEVTVRFAVKNLDMIEEKGSLESYPGADDEYGMIFVSPQETSDGRYSKMSNLNGQGGDMSIARGEIELFGDGDGEQYTRLVIWDADDEDRKEYEGYVRDYGPAYGEEESFKQFIKCSRSNKPF